MTSNRAALFLSLFVIFAASAPLAALAQAPFLFNRLPGAPADLRTALFARSAGGAETAIGVPLVEAAIPAVSNNGRFVAVTSSDPARPNMNSKDVFVHDLATGVARKVADFDDFTSPGPPLTSTTVTPFFKAFSPDGTRLAVTSLFTTVVSQNPNNPDPNGGIVKNKTLNIYDVATGSILASVISGPQTDSSFTDMDGVTWSRVTGELVTPVQTGASPLTVTALWGMAPGNGGPNSRQITTPQSFQFNSAAGFESHWHNDTLPAFSPTGGKIAYFRILNRIIVPFGGAPVEMPALVSLRMVNTDGSNDRALFNFNEGFYPTGLSWSPDRTQLVLGIARQISGNLVDPATGRMLTIPSGGGDVAPVGELGILYPVWSPSVVPTPPPVASVPRLAIERSRGGASGGGFVLRAIDAEPGASFVLETSPDLVTWTPGRAVSGAEANAGIEMATEAGVKALFCRLRMAGD